MRQLQLLFAFLFLFFCDLAKAQIVINELGIAPVGGTDGKGGEFVELYNMGSCPVDLSCYTLVFSSTSGSNNATGWTIKIPSGKTIPACGYFLIGGIASSGGTSGTGYPNANPLIHTVWPYFGTADLDIGTFSISNNAVYMKQRVNAGTFPNAKGQIALLNSLDVVVSSVAYNNGNNAATYPLSAYVSCKTSGNVQGYNNIPDPGASSNNISFSGPGGIYLNASGVYVSSTTLTPGLANPSQTGCSPTIIISPSAANVCYNSTSQTTNLFYSATTNSPTNYSITWDPIPTNNFISVTNELLPSNAITIQIPAGASSGTYTGYITVSNAVGTSCSTSFSLTVNARPTVIASANADIICSEGSGTIITVNGALNYIWSPTAGLSSADGSSVKANPASTTTYIITGTDANNCSNTTSVTINVSKTPDAPEVDVIQPSCNRSTGSISITSSTEETLTYSIGSNYTTEKNFSNLSPGSYVITAKNNDGCTSSVTTAIINPQPITPMVGVNNAVVCPGSLATIIATPAMPGIYSYSWTVPPGEKNPGNVSGFNAGTAGDYTVVITNSTGCNATATGRLSFTNMAIITTNDISICSNSIVPLTGQPSGGSWSGPHIIGSNFDATGLVPGLYIATYTVSSGSCTGTSLATIAVKALPLNPLLTIVHPNCNISTGTIFINASAETVYSINGSDFSSNAFYSNLAPGKYVITTKNSSGCTVDTTITINASPLIPSPPTVQLIQPSCTVATGTINITAPAGNGLTYSVNGIDYFDQLSFSFLLNGIYYVTAKNSEGCVSAKTAVSINTQPITPAAPVVSAVNNCDGTSTLTATEAVGSLLWSNGSVATSITVTNEGMYSVTQTVNGCISAESWIMASPASTPLPPTLKIIQPNCNISTATIDIISPTGNGYSYSINGNDYQTINSFKVVPGSYQITTRNNSGCVSNSVNVNIAEPVKTLIQTNDRIGCGAVVHNGIIFTSSTIAKDTLKSVLNCDSIIRITNIVVHKKPSPTYVNVCLSEGQSYDFNGTVFTSGGQYTDTLTAVNGCDSIVHLHLVVANVQTLNLSGCDSLVYNGTIYTSPITLHEKVLSLLNGCDSIIRTVNIIIHPKPQITISPDKKICAGTPISLTAFSVNASIDWLGMGSGNTINAMPSTTTTYTAKATSTNGCNNTATVTISVQHFTVLLFAIPNPAIAGTVTHLQTQASSPYQIISWQPAIFSNAVANSQNFVADTVTTVSVIAKSLEGCVDTAFITLRINPLKDIFIPSAFTPNGDGKNDVFRILGGEIKELDMKVFNRWGQVIFSTHERIKGWEGSFAGKGQPNGTYVYSVKAILKDGTVIHKKGTVMLIR